MNLSQETSVPMGCEESLLPQTLASKLQSNDWWPLLLVWLLLEAVDTAGHSGDKSVYLRRAT